MAQVDVASTRGVGFSLARPGHALRGSFKVVQNQKVEHGAG